MDSHKLSDVCLMIKRGTQPKYSEDGTLVINQKCIRDYKINLDLARHNDEDQKKTSEEKKLQQWDVLINSTGVGTLGRVAQVTTTMDNATVDSHVTIVRPNLELLDGSYFGYYLKSLQSLIETLGEGATGQTELSRNRIGEDLEIKIPPKQQQVMISEALTSFDDLISYNTRRIEILEESAKALYREWFVHYRYPGHENDTMVDSELGLIPKGWEVKKLADCPYKITKPKVTPYDLTKIYLATADVTNFNRVIGGTSTAYEDLPSRAQHEPVPESVWIGRMAGYQKILVYPEGEKNLEDHVLSSGFLGISCPVNWLPFVTFQFLDPLFEKKKANFATGSTQVSLTDSGAKQMPLLVPDTETVLSFDIYVRPIMEILSNLRRNNNSLEKSRDLLLPRLISGELDVSDLDFVA